MNKKILEKMDGKLDSISDKVHNIDTRVTLMESHDKVQNEQLEYHIKRTDDLEAKVLTVDKDVSNIKFLKAHIYSALTIVAMIVTVLHKMEIL